LPRVRTPASARVQALAWELAQLLVGWVEPRAQVVPEPGTTAAGWERLADAALL